MLHEKMPERHERALPRHGLVRDVNDASSLEPAAHEVDGGAAIAGGNPAIDPMEGNIVEVRKVFSLDEIGKAERYSLRSDWPGRAPDLVRNRSKNSFIISLVCSLREMFPLGQIEVRFSLNARPAKV